MKHNHWIVLGTVMLFASCSTNYVVTDRVMPRLDGSRTLLSGDTTSLAKTPFGSWQRSALATPMSFDFRTSHDTMRYAYSRPMAAGGWTESCDTLSRMLRPVVEVKKRFRWFTTRYSYTARFHHLDSLPVPVAEYLSEEEQRLLFCSNEMPADWNGADLYAVLDELNSKYMRWWNHCYFEKEYEIYCRYADSAQRALLAHYHDTLLAVSQKRLSDPEETSGSSQQSLSRLGLLEAVQPTALGMTKMLKEMGVAELAAIGDAISEEDVEEKMLAWTERCCEKEVRVLWRVELPGGVVREHLVSSERLIMGDYTVEEGSRVLNWWAIAVTALLAAVPLVVVFRPRRRG